MQKLSFQEIILKLLIVLLIIFIDFFSNITKKPIFELYTLKPQKLKINLFIICEGKSEITKQIILSI